MFSWGEQCRQGFRLKDGTYVSNQSAREVSFLDLGFDITHLSAGLRVLSFVKRNGNAFIIGTNESQDGTRVRGKQKCVESKEKIRAVSCGDHVVIMLSKKGQVLCVDTTHTKINPRPLEALRGISVSQVSCGSQHSVALTKDGQVFTWGLNSRGQLGLGSSGPSVTFPQHVKSLAELPLVQVAAGGEQSFSLSVSGNVFSWGSNTCGQLGLGDTTDRHAPTLVHRLHTKKTCFISCGETHTAILTKDGAVFTFGSGRHGQLGHNSFKDELQPRLVAELWGSKVTEVACGRQHTLVLTESQKMYSFGCGDQGQLGHGKKSHPAVPLPVQLPKKHKDGPSVRHIFAGGNCSFATCPLESVNTTGTKVQPGVDDLINKWASDSEPWKQIKQEILRTFSSASRLNRGFLEHRKDKHFQTSTKCCGLDLPAVHRLFTNLPNKNKVLEQAEAAAIPMLPCLDQSPVGVEALRVYLLLIELLVVVQFKKGTELAEELAAAIQRLSADSRQVLVYWWSTQSYSTRERHVEVWRQALSEVLSSESFVHESNILNLVLVLQDLYNVNKEMTAAEKLPETAFSLGLSETILQKDVPLWRSVRINKLRYVTPPLVLCQYPFLMDLQTKKLAFDFDSDWTKLEHQAVKQQSYFDWLLGWRAQLVPDFFQLKLKRTSLLEDTFQQLAACSHSALKKPLTVCFDGDSNVTDVYKRDFFHHLFLKIVSSDSEMFVFNDSKTLAWFPSRQVSEDEEKSFFFFGVLCGLALYNQSIIYLPFPLALFKKLLGVRPSLDDLRELSLSVGKSLQYVLDYEEDLQNLDMDFSIVWDETEVELDPLNPGKPVTNHNKKEFVEAYVNHVFNTSVESAFEEFRRGFFQVCDQYAVQLFRPEELRGVLVGSEIYDWAIFKKNTVYEPEYHFQHPTIQMFWEVFDKLNEEQKKDFLWFLTGFRIAPILGLGQIQMNVRVKLILYGSINENFPQSLTCHSILDLPLYSSKKVLMSRLTEAIKPEQGFTR